ncbi:MAG TPA: AAA family ATPase [bacterium]|nr:AAA family ATPase [bacterium]HPI75218.1 AAA family ATPase [bacterium]HPN92944.1 AAA family ATPase [bacterium]
MDRKIMAAVVSSRAWTDLNESVAAFDNVELLSPLQNMEDLKKAASRSLLDIVFIDIEEFNPSLNGNGVNFDKLGLYAVFISRQNDPILMKAAMRAGGRDFIAGQVGKEEIGDLLNRANEGRKIEVDSHGKKSEEPETDGAPGKVVTFFSTKGGAGKSALAVNYAISLAQRENCRVCLLDLDLQFGDLALIMNLKPRASISDLIASGSKIEDEIDSYLLKRDENVFLLASPQKPEESELVTGEHVKAIVEALTYRFKYIIIDTAASFHDVSLAALDKSDVIHIVLTPIILAVKDLKGMLDVMTRSLEYPPEKIKVILNRSDSQSGISGNDIEKLCKRKMDYSIPSDGNVVVPSINTGIPAVISYPRSKFSKAVRNMAEDAGETAPVAAAKTSIFSFLKIGNAKNKKILIKNLES